MAAYVVGYMTVKNPSQWKEYRDKVQATMEPYGGKVILRGRRSAVLAGEHQYTASVVMGFPSTDAASQWYGSAAYQALIPIRDGAADIVLITYEEF
jgi:uncharacterized protein (DUF1330 family)